MNFEDCYNILSSHRDELNQINRLYLNITSKGLSLKEIRASNISKKVYAKERVPRLNFKN